ncbi:hypothetical protein BGX27_009366 [Mortierella sp. AM989]|nr:hypothetical protein BGX27_009366 [Mortierella sp. AM989]
MPLSDGSLPSARLGATSDYVRIPDDPIFHPTNPTTLYSPIKRLIKAMYPTVETARSRSEDIIKCAILATPILNSRSALR